MEVPTIQGLMDKAYARWQDAKDWTQEDFTNQLDADEKLAVVFGNMNYQVENGGFSQWRDNRYGTPEIVGYVRRQLAQMEGDKIPEMRKLIVRVKKVFDTFPLDWMEDDWTLYPLALDPLDKEFYAINDAVMAAVEAKLAALPENREVTCSE